MSSLLECSESNGLDTAWIVSQCYDVAMVMRSGVVKKLENILKKPIPYVNCSNHSLHLVLIGTLKRIDEVLFDQLQLIHNLFKIRAIYEGRSINRLLATRGTGHKKIAVAQNYDDIVSTLQQVITEKSLKIAEDISISHGILNVILKKL